jgi:hypothetical protein
LISQARPEQPRIQVRFEGRGFTGGGKTSALHLILGGAGVYRCDHCFLSIGGFIAAEVGMRCEKRFFRPCSAALYKFNQSWGFSLLGRDPWGHWRA